MMMIYESKTGDTVKFDDYEQEDTGATWVAICKDCWKKYKDTLENAKHSPASCISVCYVKDCRNEAEFYIDFTKEQKKKMRYTHALTVKFRKSYSFMEEFEATEEEINQIKAGENPFWEELQKLNLDDADEVEGDYSVIDEETGETLIEWD